MFFDDWKDKSEGMEISRHLLGEYDLSDFDWQKMRTVVVRPPFSGRKFDNPNFIANFVSVHILTLEKQNT